MTFLKKALYSLLIIAAFCLSTYVVSKANAKPSTKQHNLRKASRDNGILISNAWSRSTNMIGGTGVVYLKITNNSSKNVFLTSAASKVTDRVELHNMKMENNIMKMRRIKKIKIKRGQKIELKPGGLHIMLINLKQKLRKGDKFDITLNFKNSRPITTQVIVK